MQHEIEFLILIMDKSHFNIKYFNIKLIFLGYFVLKFQI